MTEWECYYCGEPADTIDHVLPRNALARIEIVDPNDVRNRVLIVRCCRECNCLIGGKWFDSLAERKAYAKERIRQRYRKYLAMPEWESEEIEAMGYNLRAMIKRAMDIRRKTKFRLTW